MGFKVDFSNIDWGSGESSAKVRGRPEDVERVQHMLDKAAETFEGRSLISRQGRPYTVFTRDGCTYSLHYSLSGVWTLFYPFPSWGANSKRLAFDNLQEVVNYFD